MPGEKHERRKVLTMFGERGWDDNTLDSSSAERGFERINTEINDLATRVTIHSISCSTVLLPESSPVILGRLWIYATILYSGDLDLLEYFGKVDPETGHQRRNEDTTFRVFL